MSHRCPSDDQLARFLDQTGDPRDSQLVEAHVRSCATCQETLAGLSGGTDVVQWQVRLQQNPPIPAEEQDGLEQFLTGLKSRPPSTLAVQPGARLGNCDLLELRGQGGMGTIFKARHRHMDRLVAVKVLSRTITNNADAIERFRREVRAVARLSHPNIVTAFDADLADGVPFLVMEFVDGCDLSRHVKEQGPLPVRDAVELILEAARGLEYAHSVGIIHRDIKPSNLMLLANRHDTSFARSAPSAAPARIKILDLGLAGFQAAADPSTAGSGEGALTHSGAVIGTVDYMSPEQALDSKSADARSDIYSLGCTLHYLLTGATTYEGDTFTQSVVAHRESPVPRLGDVRPDVSAELDAVFGKMLAKRPEDRFPSMSAVVAALSSLVERRGAAQPASSPRRPTAVSRNRLASWCVACAATLTVVAGIGWATSTWRTWQPAGGAPATSDPWQPGSADDVIPGILRRPRALPGIDRWQVETVAPRNLTFATAWSPDGSLVACGGIDRQIRVYDARSFRLVQLLTGHDDAIAALKWHPSERWIASAASDGTARVWDVDRGMEHDRFEPWPMRNVIDVAWNGDGTRLAVVGDDARVHLWTLGAENRSTSFGEPGIVAHSVCWSPQGTHLATGSSDGRLRIWDVAGTLEFTSDDVGYRIQAVDWHPAGDWIAVGGAGVLIRLFQPDGTPGPQLPGPAGGVFALQWSRNGRHLAASGMNGNGQTSVHVWNDEQRSVAAFNAGAHVQALSWSPEGQRVAVSDWNNGVAIWSIAGHRLLGIGDSADVITDLAWNQDGTRLVVATKLNAIRLLSDDGLQRTVLTTDSARHLRAVDWLDDETIVATYLSPGGRVAYWSNGTIERHTAVFPDDKTSQMSLDVRPVDGLLAVGRGPSVRTVARDGTRRESTSAGTGVICQLAWNPRHDMLAASFTDGTVRVGNRSGAEREWSQVASGIDTRIAWHPDGRRLAVGCQDSIQLVVPGTPDSTRVACPFGAVEFLSWSRQGVLASAHADGSVRLWDE